MKLATFKDGTRDGQLAVAARDLKIAHIADGIAPTLQAALDDWALHCAAIDRPVRGPERGAGPPSVRFRSRPLNGAVATGLSTRYQRRIWRPFRRGATDGPLRQCWARRTIFVVAAEEWGSILTPGWWW